MILSPALRLLAVFLLIGLDRRINPQFYLFRIITPVTKPELLYAIETTLQLNHVTIARREDRTIRAESIK
jgi:hypothetical protein